MKRSKNQAIHKFLPGMWMSDNSDERLQGRTVTAKVKAWTPKRMEGIYEDYIEAEIKRMLRIFDQKHGDISSYRIQTGEKAFRIVEPARAEGIPDIIGEISPLLFYCSHCHLVFEEKSSKNLSSGIWICANCGKNTVKQLQMIYACECGFAQPVGRPYIEGVKDFKYYPNDSPYKMKYSSGGAVKIAELIMKCSACGNMLRPDNAESGRNYKPFHLSLVNLIDDNYGRFLKVGINAQKVITAKWFELISQKEYQNILENVQLAFDESNSLSQKRQEAEKQARGLVKLGLIPESELNAVISELLNNQNETLSPEQYIAQVDEIFALKRNQKGEDAYNDWLTNFAFKLVQYDTLKYAKNRISLEESVACQTEMELIENAFEIEDLNRRLGIANAQVSCDIEIITCAYGYTRRVAEPGNAKNKLRLIAYDKNKEDNTHLVYGIKLETEGILFEISQSEIISWLLRNKVIKKEQVPDLESSVSVKKWFAEQVHGEQVSTFGTVENENGAEAVTQQIFAMLHSMSHALLKSAGEISGLSSNSLGEIILVETASIFIYAKTSQGIPLGALSGMFENNYASFLKTALEENRNCIYDPICLERDNTCCMACLLLPEVSCSHFNAELGRKYLYTLKGVGSEKEIIGFWDRCPEIGKGRR